MILENHYSECVWTANTRNLTHIDPHDLTDGCIKLLGIIEVDSDDMRPADVLLCIGMLRGHLRQE